MDSKEWRRGGVRHKLVFRKKILGRTGNGGRAGVLEKIRCFECEVALAAFFQFQRRIGHD